MDIGTPQRQDINNVHIIVQYVTSVSLTPVQFESVKFPLQLWVKT